ncbi:MAG: asparagine synthetase B, partial [Zetaproteobacteria bacterium]
MGHRRLAIRDLSPAGRQPMSDASGEVWIVFNGEIYNDRELAEELDYPFRTRTDTEVLLAAYLAWGERMLDRLNGMFAFVIYDHRTKEVFAARDRFGIKPLYAWRPPGGGWMFASEIKQFTAHPKWRARMHPQKVYDFLNWGLSDHARETMFADVIQFLPGEY